jgi:hypothetical protein
MNNTINFYRVSHKFNKFLDTNISPGPYSFFGNIIQRNPADMGANMFCKIVGKNEDVSYRYKQFNIDNYKLKSVPTLNFVKRPGPFEDMELRSKMINKMGNQTKNGVFHLYGFDSICQFLNWYHDEKELQFLEFAEFELVNMIVPKKHVLFGKNQCVYFPENTILPIKIKASYELTTFYKSFAVNLSNNKRKYENVGINNR